MASPILTAFPFPWERAEAQELHLTLCELYPTTRSALFVAEKQGVPTHQLQLEQQPYFLWKDILETLAKRRGGVQRLVEFVTAQEPDHPKVSALVELLAGRGAIARPTTTPDDRIGDPEALLFHDDLMLSVGRLGWLIEILGRLQSIAPAICRVVCSYNGPTAYGTAFRIGPDLLLTNWHVLHNPSLNVRATQVTAQFRYELDTDGRPAEMLAVACAADTIVTGDSADDWGVIRVAASLPDSIPIIPLASAAEPKPGTPAFIVQHANGDYKRVGFVRNQITSADAQYLYYLTDTQVGSSGSPVFDERCRLIGLHHWGGTPQEVAGKPPLRKNRGIAIPRVVAGLAQNGVAA